MEFKTEILPGINPKQFFPDAKHIIIYAFTIGDRNYFRFDDPLNIPYDRALKTLVYYKELDMNCDREYLKAHTAAFDKVLSGTKITITELVTLKQMNDQIKQRLELPKEPDLMYKLAAVVFFDQHENPMTYEFKYGENKIRFWKKNLTLTDFFLQKPLVELIPYLQYADINLEQFSRMTERATERQLAKLLPMLSEEQRQTLKNKFRLSPTT
jgi:hypothetical protein